MQRQRLITKFTAFLGAAVLGLCVAFAPTQSMAADEKPVQVGTITMEQVQIAWKSVV